MENASKALLIGGGILIGMLVISIGVILFMNYKQIGASYEQNQQLIEMQKFNQNFIKFEGRTDITIYEIISLANFAREYNKNNNLNFVNRIEVIVIDASNNSKYLVWGRSKTDEPPDLTEIIKHETEEIKHYKIDPINGIGYNSEKLINRIFFKEI